MYVHGNAFDYRYSGSNNLLVNGAKCILNSNDILKYYPQIEKQNNIKKEKVIIASEYKTIYNELIKEEQNIDSLSKKITMPISELNSKLLLMEMERIDSKRKWQFL